MADKLRSADAEWNGDLRHGKGQVSTSSGVLSGVRYSFSTRFEDEPGSNPEELIAAAHAACYSMAFANTLAGKGYQPESIQTHATCHLSPKDGGGFYIRKMLLETKGRVGGLDQATFEKIALEAEKGCPVSNALRAIEIEVKAQLLA
ncbi:MAG: OsmC family protein [Chloroflexi bacterium]|nr:OsmC family protein [Chloroflexota bacterium]